MINVPFYSMKRMHEEISHEIEETLRRVVKDNRFVRGRETLNFEDTYADFVKRKFAIACGSGLDALYLMLRAYGIGEGDEVIVPSDTFYATALAVVQLGAIPIFVEPDILSFNMNPSLLESSITEKTKAIIVVHLYGQIAEMETICEIAKKHKLLLFEDAAQAHGATRNGRLAGTFGCAAAFSFYPGKNLGAFGDAGAVVTDDKEVAEKIHALGNYGCDYQYHYLYCGRNSRIDETNAAVLTLKLKYLQKWNKDKQKTANVYLSNVNNPKIKLPTVLSGNEHIWHIFAIRCQERDVLKKYLEGYGIFTYINYPIPMHLQPAFKFLGIRKGDLPIAEEISETELSIPMWYGMKDEEIAYVIEKLNKF